MRIGFLLSTTWHLSSRIGRPVQQELIGAIPTPLPIRMGNSFTVDLPDSVHRILLHTNDEQEDTGKTYRTG
jgi:hypothetical protein